MTFPNMAEIIAPAIRGCAVVSHYEITKLDAMHDSWHGIPTVPGKVACLHVNGKLVMSDSYHEQRSNIEVLREARGHVLIAGLGLGMILHPILAKPQVQSVTVIEKYQDVIDLIIPTLPKSDKLTVICADIFKFQPAKKVRWDTVYFDIWADICTDSLEEIAMLHQRFKTRKAKGGWMGSWYQDELRDRKRRGV